jgi:DNA-directed RNA polymerase specialized sigma subunit
MPNTSYENENKALSTQSEAIVEMLTDRGLVDDRKITDTAVRRAVKDKKRKMYHSTEIMLQKYRDVTWMLERLPANISKELDKPMKNIDALLSMVNNELDMDNQKLQTRLKSIRKSRLLHDCVNEALSVLKQKPSGGKLMYEIIYQTYIVPEKLTHLDIIYRLGISTRHYYRLRQQAINIISLRLWAAPSAELDSWLDVLAILENI